MQTDLRDVASIPGLGRSLEENVATHSSILAWRIPWTEEPGELQSTGSQRVGHDSARMRTRARNLGEKVNNAVLLLRLACVALLGK